MELLVTAWYPPNKAKELLKVYTAKDKPAYPDFIKKNHHWTAVSSDGHYKTYAVYEFPEEKIKQALQAIGKRYSLYATVEGYRYYPEILMDAEEAIKIFL
ncbi:MAG: hypothetical protein ACFFDF_19920 [Candidatus Odinarchaeota archaeon]